MGQKLCLVDEPAGSTGLPPVSPGMETSLLFGSALDVVPFPCLRIDDQGVIQALNPAAAEFLGINAALRRVCPVSAFVAPGQTTAFFQFLRRIIRTHEPQRCTLPIRSKGGAPRVVQFDARREGPTSTLLSLIDVSEREHALTRLRGSELRLRSLLETLPDAVFVVADGVVVHCNPAAHRITAAPPVGRTFAQLLEPEQCPLITHHSMGTPTEAERHELCFSTLDGAPRAVETLWMPIDFEGRAAHLCVARDRTEQRRLEAQMAHADRLATVGVLAQGVAHELNNPLTYVTMNVRELVDALESKRSFADAERAELAESAREAADGASRMARIVADLQGLARVDDEPTSMDLNVVVERCLVLAQAQMRARVQVHKRLGSLPAVSGDAGRMTQVVLNLLINAVQALPERGGQIWVETFFEGSGAVLEIRDDGPGISAHVRDRMFEPFVTTKPVGDGTGLGLFVCHQYVTECGGSLEALDAPEGGARLRVKLSRAGKTELVEESGSRARSVQPRSRPAVLVIDDEPVIRETLSRQLSRHLDVTVVGNAEAALALWSAGGSFDLTLCDLMMPGHGARWLYAALLERCPEAVRSFCVMTGGAVDPQDARFLAQAAPPLLRKPFSSSDVISFIENAVNAPESAPSGPL